jgi:hypothetical protein
VKLTSHGIDVDVPRGWDGEIYRREELTTQSEGGGVSQPVVHLANFPLPPARGDFGSGAVEVMHSDDLLIVLFEYGPESVASQLFSSEGFPVVSADDFDPNTMQRPLPGQSGAQYFFNASGRAFCLYVVLGSHVRRNELVPEVNAVLAAVSLSA